jgi:hypothetical protein
MRGTWREGSFTGNPKGYAKSDSENGRLFPQGPHFCGTYGDGSFLGPLRKGKNVFIREIFMRNLICKKKAFQMGRSLHRGPVGEPGGGLFTGTSE